MPKSCSARQGATDADCWTIRDPLSAPFTNVAVLRRFKAHRDGCMFRQTGLKNPRTDAWEIWEMGTIRPDWMLADVIKMVHPPLRDGSGAISRPRRGSRSVAARVTTSNVLLLAALLALALYALAYGQIFRFPWARRSGRWRGRPRMS